MVTDRGVKKQEFEAYVSKMKASVYFGYKWELLDNDACIYDMSGGPQKKG